MALVLALSVILLAAALPPVLGAVSRARVATAARELSGLMARVRGTAIAEGVRMAIRLEWSEGHYRYAIYRDGDGDGVRAEDIGSGRDPLIEAPKDLPSRYAGIDFGLLDEAIPEVPPGTGVLPPGGDPVRFGSSDTITFTPRGTSSSGTLYVGDGRGLLAAVVLYGGTGRIRACRFERDLWAWRC